jgi:hypothetical protein
MTLNEIAILCDITRYGGHKQDQDCVDKEISLLIRCGYIATDPNGFHLTEKGETFMIAIKSVEVKEKTVFIAELCEEGRLSC